MPVLPRKDEGQGSASVLAPFGYRDIVGIDMSEGMLEQARRKGLYRDHCRMVLGCRLDLPDAAFAAIAALGVFTTGHAPVSSFQELLRVTEPGGYLIFNLNTRLHATGGFAEVMEVLERDGRWTLLEATAPFVRVPLRDPPIETRAYVYRVS